MINKTPKYLKTTVYLVQCSKLPAETDALSVMLPHIWQQGGAVTCPVWCHKGVSLKVEEAKQINGELCPSAVVAPNAKHEETKIKILAERSVLMF